MPPEEPTFPTARDSAELEGGSVFAPRFDDHGLLAAIVTDEATGGVLMFAWMNRLALSETLKSGQAHFWSRSRQRLWKKGEESGNLLEVVSMRVDCDQDALWLTVRVKGDGVACHTGAKSCFYRSVRVDQNSGSVTLAREE